VAAVTACLAILIALGTWQLQRREWKRGILDAIAAAEAAPPRPLEGRPPDFTRVVVSGRLLHDRQALVGSSSRQAGLGGQLVVPLVRDGEPPILVDRGWVPADRRRALAQAEGQVTIVGYVRPADRRNWFTPADDPAARRFFVFDPPAIGAALGVPEAAPFVLVALGAPPADGYPAPARTLPRPSNNHLSYAITWYGLAVALLAVAFARILRKPA
jgi:surfeit locus 1 family protein